MDVQPVKKYRAPLYPTLDAIGRRDFYKNARFTKHQKLLIAAATAVLCGSLAGCTPTGGTPPTESPRTAGVPLPTQDIDEYEAQSALQSTAEKRDAGAPVLPADGLVSYDWNEEADIQAAFIEFLDWMRAEGVV